jgi:hypothetical protein
MGSCSVSTSGDTGLSRERIRSVGTAESWMMEQYDQGWSYSDKMVCGACVGEDSLRSGVEADSSGDEVCSFCGGSPAAPLDSLLGLFMGGLRRLYDKADNHLFWEDDFTPRYDSWDLVQDYSLETAYWRRSATRYTTSLG